MDEAGFVFIPYSCALNPCKVHVAFHGCGESKEFLGDEYVKNTGYLEQAGPNEMVVVFPQAHSIPETNISGCWDFWGYTGPDYLTKDGPQAKAIRLMVERL